MPDDPTPPKVSSVTIRNYRPHSGLSEETRAFTATIYLDGKRAGQASNTGQGGPNRYDFADPHKRDAFFAYATAWGVENDETFESEDALIDELCTDYELRSKARTLVNRGAEKVLFIEKGPGWFTEDKSGKPAYYDESYLIGLRTDTDPEAIAAKEGADKWRVIATD
jgi:hypothetical protein